MGLPGMVPGLRPLARQLLIAGVLPRPVMFYLGRAHRR